MLFRVKEQWGNAMTSEDSETGEEEYETLCRHGGEPGDCFRPRRCGHTCDEHDYRRSGACGVEGCDC